MPTIGRPTRLSTVLLGATFLVACSGAAAPSAPSAPSVPPVSVSSPSPSEPSDVGGGAPGDPGSGSGIVDPGGPTPIDPGAGQPTIVMPKPGRLDPHPVAPIALRASVDGRHVLVKIAWYGGVAPCSVLDSVKVERSGKAIALTVVEGADEANAICPELAMLKATIVDLGELEPGTWTISATTGDVAPIELTIS